MEALPQEEAEEEEGGGIRTKGFPGKTNQLKLKQLKRQKGLVGNRAEQRYLNFCWFISPDAAS